VFFLKLGVGPSRVTAWDLSVMGGIQAVSRAPPVDLFGGSLDLTGELAHVASDPSEELDELLPIRGPLAQARTLHGFRR
jgi:hypothetical protein